MSTKFITVPSKTLASTIISSDMLLKPSDILGFDGVALTSSIIGDTWYCTLKDSSGTKMEIMKLDPTTVGNYATTGITITKRGLSFDGAETEVTANKLTWIKNETIINFGTDVPQLLELMVKKEGNETIAGIKTFSSSPIVPTPTTNMQAATKKYVDDKTGSALAVEVSQSGHGFTVGDIIRLSGINTYTKAKADSAANAEVVGIVTTVTDANNFAYTTEGVVTVGVPAVAAETVLFLSATTAGALTATAPTTAGYINLPLAVVTQNATKMVFHKYRGMELGNSSVGATSVATYTASGTTLSLTTGANDKVVVWAKGGVTAPVGSPGLTISLKYNGTTKDSTVLGATAQYTGASDAFALEYTETPGAGTQNITVTTSSGSLSDVVIIAQVITPVSVQNSITSTSGVSVGPASSSTQTITHGLGRTPSIIRLNGISQYSYGTSGKGYSNGIYNSSGNHCVYSKAWDNDTFTSSTYSIRLDYYASGGPLYMSSTGIVQNVTATTFDIVWTNTGNSGDTTGSSFIWEAQ